MHNLQQELLGGLNYIKEINIEKNYEKEESFIEKLM